MELSKHIEGVRVACREEGWPLRPEIVDLVVDAWHKATKEATRAERERCIGQLNKLADGYFNAQYLDHRNQDRGFTVLRCVNTIHEREADDAD